MVCYGRGRGCEKCYFSQVISREVFLVSKGHKKPEDRSAKMGGQPILCAFSCCERRNREQQLKSMDAVMILSYGDNSHDLCYSGMNLSAALRPSKACSRETWEGQRAHTA